MTAQKMPKIEKGVPRPFGKPRGRAQAYPFLQMKVGDSFFLKTDNPEAKRTNVLNAASHLRHWRPATHAAFRITTMIEKNGVRVWRTH